MTAGGEPAVLIATQRRLRPQVARCVGYEMESVIAQHSLATWAELTHGRLGRPAEVAVNRLNRRFRAAARLPSPLHAVQPTGEFDVMVAIMQLPSDLVTVDAIRHWRERSAHAVCFIEEMWALELDRWRGHLALLERFDHVFLGSYDTVAPLRERISTPVSYLPYGVDTARFAPVEFDVPRWIDVCNIGRRSPITHHALLERSRRHGHFYFHDTFTPGPYYQLDEHREQLARLMRATNVAITNRGIGARAHETGGQQELGFRYFEAAAAGALLVGQPPPIPVVEELFDWPDAIIEAPFDDPAIGTLLDELAKEPDRVDRARRANVINSLRRHDHIHRWQAMLDAVGVPSGDRVADRIGHLEARAGDLD